MFLGFDLCSGKYAMTPNYTSIEQVTSVRLKNATYDHLYLSANPDQTIENLDDGWEYDTKINADYSESLEGGNTGFSLKNTDTIIIKRREKGTMNWVTIFTIPVTTADDFNFIKEYNYGSGDTDYDIMVISSIGGRQNSYETTECRSAFDGICIADKEYFYRTIFNITETDLVQNITSNIVMLLNNKYPVIISNSDDNYTSGTVTAVFLKVENCEIVTGKRSTNYRSNIISWLCNKKAKILKLENGTTKLIRVIGTPTIADGGHPELKTISFDFVEIGDTESEKDLYTTALSDVEPNKW